MNINNEILKGIGFEKIKIGNTEMYTYESSICTVYLENSNNNYKLYEKVGKEFRYIGACYNVGELMQKIIKFNTLKAVRKGEQNKQEEIKRILGL